MLLHDSSEDQSLRRFNRTGTMTMKLIPILKSRGYRFVPLREIPQVREAIEAAAEPTTAR